MSDPKVIVTTDKKLKVFGLIMLLLIAAFCMALVGISNANSDKEIAHYENSNKVNVQEDKKAAAQRDLFLKRTLDLQIKLGGVKGQLKENNKILGNLKTSYDKNLLQTKQLRNEKNYIPTNVPFGIQSTYISGYEYNPY